MVRAAETRRGSNRQIEGPSGDGAHRARGLVRKQSQRAGGHQSDNPSDRHGSACQCFQLLGDVTDHLSSRADLRVRPRGHRPEHGCLLGDRQLPPALRLREDDAIQNTGGNGHRSPCPDRPVGQSATTPSRCLRTYARRGLGHERRRRTPFSLSRSRRIGPRARKRCTASVGSGHLAPEICIWLRRSRVSARTTLRHYETPFGEIRRSTPNSSASCADRRGLTTRRRAH